MVKAFEMAGYSEDTVKEKFGALYNAFHYGAPPHAGMAPGVDRMIMLLQDEENMLLDEEEEIDLASIDLMHRICFSVHRTQ
jgi:hypothetical protein